MHVYEYCLLLESKNRINLNLCFFHTYLLMVPLNCDTNTEE